MARKAEIGGKLPPHIEWQGPFGALSAANWLAMPLRRYMEDFGLTREQLAAIPLNARRNAGLNPDAIYRDPLTLEDYLGADLKPWLDRIFQGRELKLLGYNRQRIPGNWKLMMENIKDPYHPGLLHTWFVTFGLWRADQRSRMVMDAHGRHAVMISRRNDGGENKTVLSSQALESAFLARAAILTSRYDVVYGRPEALIPPTKMEIDVKRPDVRVMAPRWVATK